jgi:hypothetical protein
MRFEIIRHYYLSERGIVCMTYGGIFVLSGGIFFRLGRSADYMVVYLDYLVAHTSGLATFSVTWSFFRIN